MLVFIASSFVWETSLLTDSPSQTHKSSARQGMYKLTLQRRAVRVWWGENGFDLQEVLRDAASVQKAAQQPWRDGWGLRESELTEDTLCLSGPEEFNGMRFDLAPYNIFAICEMPKHCIFYHAKSSGRSACVCSVNVPEQTLELIFHSNETQRPRMWDADDVWL